MIDSILQHVTRIPLHISRFAQQSRLGQHHSRRRGAGLEFDQITAYQEGDPIRNINWAATARRGGETPLVNAHYEDTDLTVMLLVDLSASMDFGSARVTKRTLAAEICASLVYSALAAHDRIGLLGFTSDVACYVPPRHSWAYLRAIPERILHGEAEKSPASFWTAMAHLECWVRRPALVFLLSDFLTEDTQQLHHALARLGRRHELIALIVTDPLEVALPTGTARMVTRDLETGHVRSYILTRRNHQHMAAREQVRQAQLRHLFQQAGIAYLTVTPHSHYREELSQLLLTGHRRARV